MKFYKDANNKVFAYEDDGSQDQFIDPGLMPISQAEADSLRFPAATFQELVNANTAAIQAELDRQAAAKGYDNIISACSYAAQDIGAPFQAEGAAFLAWRSKVWQQAYTDLSAVEAGTQPMPTPAQAVADMPALVLTQ